MLMRENRRMDQAEALNASERERIEKAGRTRGDHDCRGYG